MSHLFWENFGLQSFEKLYAMAIELSWADWKYFLLLVTLYVSVMFGERILRHYPHLLKSTHVRTS